MSTDLFDNAGPLMTEHGWWRREGESAIHDGQVAMAHATGRNFDQYFSPLGRINLDFFDYQGCVVFVKDGGFHELFLLVFLASSCSY
jgi:hypothetical protein